MTTVSHPRHPICVDSVVDFVTWAKSCFPGKITLQTVTYWTQEGKPVNTGKSFELAATVMGAAAQRTGTTILIYFGTGDIEKMVLDYVDDAEIIEHDGGEHRHPIASCYIRVYCH